MATYNLIKSTVPSDLVEGTSGNDSIGVYGNHSTVNALGGDDIISVNGGRHDSGIWVEGDETNLINAGNGNDSIYVVSRGASIYGGNGNDTIKFANKRNGGYIYADGGSGDDVFYRSSYNPISENVTMTTGVGADTLYFDNGGYTGQFKAVVTDFSNDDAIYLDQNYYRSWQYGHVDCGAFSYTIENGNVIISDNASLSGDDVIANAITPKFTVTLQGVGSISEVADAKFYRYCGTTPLEITTLGELFGVESSSGKTSTDIDDDTEDDVSTETTTTSTTTETTTKKTTTTTEIETTTNKTTPTTSTSTSTVASGSGSRDTIINNNYYGDYYDMSKNNGTIVNQSSVEGGVTNNTSVDNSTTIIRYGNIYTYNGGNKTINDYVEGQVVELKSDYQGIDVNGNNFLVKSSSGAVKIQNSRDKFIGYSANNNNVVAYSYLASGGGQIDGRGKNQAEIMIGGDNANNQIFAGSGGSSLWGGNGGTDTMTGGDGYDEFFFAMGSGNDLVKNAGDNDVINLLGVSLSQISSFSYDSSSVDLNFNNGEHLKVESTSSVGYRVENQTFYFNRSTNQWANK
ncbi:MAG: hypothetical protein IJS29_03960 [Selenomonadaceae bacterium]|nr:hypothetical protein [Selenomonadaceae bacterium]